jgi:hypothetical protein
MKSMGRAIRRAGAALGLAIGLGAAVWAPGAAAGSDPVVYPYAFHENRCPAGLQPVVVGGSISCGVPTTFVPWQHVAPHPGERRARHYGHAGYHGHAGHYGHGGHHGYRKGGYHGNDMFISVGPAHGHGYHRGY